MQSALQIGFVVCLMCSCRIGIITGEDIQTKEICQMETLEARCGKNQVIYVQEALYGRMKKSRCVKQIFGFLGCQTNVQNHLDRQCSGRQTCSFQVASLHGQTKSANGCPEELASYLSIRYTCEPVLGCSKDICQTSDFLKSTTEQGLLSSHMMLTSGCGSKQCPWILQALPGQKINLTLVDFWGRRNHREHSQYPSTVCNRYASISEEGHVPKDIPNCGNDYQRVRPIYLSETNRVQVELYSSMSEETNIPFLIKYEVILCPDLDPPMNSEVRRSGVSVTVSCLHSKREWHLVCQGTAWVGEIGTCNDTVSSHTGDDRGSRGSPFGMLIVIGLGVALGVLIGIMLLVVVFLFMKRYLHRRREMMRRQRNLLSDSSSPGRDEIGNKLHPHGRAVHLPGGVVRYIPDHSFTATIQLKRPLPLPLEERHDFPLLTSTTATTGQTEDIIGNDGGGGGTACKVYGCAGVDAGRGTHVYETTRGTPVLGTGPTWNKAPHQVIRQNSDGGIIKTSGGDNTELELKTGMAN